MSSRFLIALHCGVSLSRRVHFRLCGNSACSPGCGDGEAVLIDCCMTSLSPSLQVAQSLNYFLSFLSSILSSFSPSFSSSLACSSSSWPSGTPSRSSWNQLGKSRAARSRQISRKRFATPASPTPFLPTLAHAVFPSCLSQFQCCGYRDPSDYPGPNCEAAWTEGCISTIKKSMSRHLVYVLVISCLVVFLELTGLMLVLFLIFRIPSREQLLRLELEEAWLRTLGDDPEPLDPFE